MVNRGDGIGRHRQSSGCLYACVYANRHQVSSSSPANSCGTSSCGTSSLHVTRRGWAYVVLLSRMYRLPVPPFRQCMSSRKSQSPRRRASELASSHSRGNIASGMSARIRCKIPSSSSVIVGRIKMLSHPDIAPNLTAHSSETGPQTILNEGGSHASTDPSTFSRSK